MEHFPWVPIWLLTKCVRPLLSKAHPWRRIPTTLEWRRLGGTDLAYTISMLLGFSFLQAVFVWSVILGRWWFS